MNVLNRNGPYSPYLVHFLLDGTIANKYRKCYFRQILLRSRLADGTICMSKSPTFSLFIQNEVTHIGEYLTILLKFNENIQMGVISCTVGRN